VWADSVITGSARNAVVGCSIFNGSTFLDNSAFNTPKVGGPGGTAAGVNVVSEVVKLSATSTISFKCYDFGSMMNAHQVGADRDRLARTPDRRFHGFGAARQVFLA
jgi:hypothetical protein